MTQRIFELLLARDGVLILQREAPKIFRTIGTIPEWMKLSMRPDELALATREPGQIFHFLDYFLDHAEAWWTAPAGEELLSDPWTESSVTGDHLILEACACFIEGSAYLLVRRLGAEYARTQNAMQVGRELALTHERLQDETSKKEILLHCIVHDLTGPLSGMSGSLDILAGENLSGEGRRILGLGQHSALRQSHFIADMLDTFRAEVGTLETLVTQPEVWPDIVATAAGVIEDLSPASGLHGNATRLVLTPGTAARLPVIGERNRLERIFFNLLQNAQRHSPRNSPITITITRDGEGVFVAVDDCGRGISPDVAPQLFQKFVRGKGHSGKAGLGLYFCRITVQQWGGKIGCEPRPEGGTRFWFRLNAG